MKVLNYSRIASADLRPLLTFVAAHSPARDLATVAVLNAEDKDVQGQRKLCTGRASKFGYADPTRPSLVEVWLTDPKGFRPNAQQWAPELPPVEIWSWEEEVVLVLAHELRHVLQFWTADSPDDPHLMEVDAERHAYEVLFAWRSRNVIHIPITLKVAA